ncbi:MAG: SOS response-associated peptidase family protein [Methylophilus sp.]|uniref:SOS response-associated peptidase family protein n=1 Tax=Methylophilus sp. TaxID=29541 RepID=UPI003F9F0D61
MCSNYQPLSKNNAGWVKENFNLELPGEEYKNHIFHGGVGPIVFLDDDKTRCELAQFGLEPHWAEDKKRFFESTYNAKSETVATLSSFRSAWKARRYAIALAEAFYEPLYEYEGAKPVWARIKRTDGQPVAIGCIWESYTQVKTGLVKKSFSMLTQDCTDHPFLSLFHKPGKDKRTIVVLDNNEMQDWLTASNDRARELIKLTDVGYLEAEGI